MIKKCLALIALLAITLFTANAQFRTTGQQAWDFASLTSKVSKQFSPRSLNGPYDCLPIRLKDALIKADLRLNRDYVSDPAFLATVTLEITAMRNGLPDLQVIKFSPVTLELTAQQPSVTFASNITSQYDDIDYITVNIVSITTGFPDIADQMQLNVYTSEDLGFDVRENALTLPQKPQPIQGKVTLNWNPSCNISPYYEVQVLRLYNNDPDYTSDNELLRAKVDWSRALSVYTKDSAPSLSLTLAEGTGYYIWRVRPVGNYFDGGSNNPLNLGSFGGSGNFQNGATVEHSNLGGNDAFYLVQPDADKNRIFTRVYADQGKSAESITYADGFLNARQSQTYDPDHEKVIATQVVLDNYGRTAIATLPIPVEQQNLTYVAGLLSNNSAPYAAENFATKPIPDPANGLTSNYYSDANPDVTIPSAGGYPFVQTRYDNQGRVAEVSSPGEFFKIGTARTVKTFYEAAKQKELNELFGQEAPNASRVTKVITFDENRTASISYYQGKKIIATSLGVTGTDGPLEDLPSKVDATSTRNENVIGEPVASSDFEIVSVTDHFFLLPQTVQFHYTLTNEAFQLLCAPVLDLQNGLDYSGTIEIINKQTGAIISNSFSVDPQLPVGVVVDTTFSVQVEEGGYQIRRVLRTNRKEANGKSFIDNYIAETRLMLEQSLKQEPTLTQIFAYLDDNDPSGLFTFLQVTKDENGYWPADVTVALQTCCSITIPVQLCPDPCASDNLDFEVYLLNKYPQFGQNINDFFYRNGNPLISDLWGTSGWFNDLIDNMMTDGYTCTELFGCWRKVVDQFGNVGTYIPGGGQDFERRVNPGYDLLKAFLDCTGTMYAGYDNQPSGWLENAHKYFKYTPGIAKDCEQAYGFDATSPWPADDRTSPKESQQWLTFYNCVKAAGTAGETAALQMGGEIGAACVSLQTDEEVLACLEEAKNKAESECAGLCEARYTSIILQLIQAYLDEGYTVQIDPGAQGSYDISYFDLNCKAEAAIQSCQQMCSLSYVTDNQGHIAGLGTLEEKRNMRRAMTEQMKVSIDNCPLGESTANAQSDGLSKLALEANLENFLNSVGPEGGCWNYAAAIDGAELSRVVDGLQPCGPGSVFVKPGVPYSLTVDGCNFSFIQKITPEAVCSGAKQLFVQLLNHTFGILDPGQQAVLETADFPEGISFKTESGGNACVNLSSFGITKSAGNEFCGNVPVGTLPQAHDIEFSYQPGSYFVLAENGTNIYVKREGQIIDVLCIALCCDDAEIGDGTLIGSVNARFNCNRTSCGPVCVSYHPVQLPPMIFEPPTCQTETVLHLREVINAQLEKFINNQLDKIADSYIDAFHKTEDNLMMEYSNGQHHYTLYYYDRAGNLIRTVAPRGVKKVDSREALTNHADKTEYTYNSLGQAIKSNSPDGGESYSFPDKLGRVRFSIKANQLAEHNRFTYLLYDNLGRVKETGEAITHVPFSIDDLRAKALNDDNYPDQSDPDIAALKHVSQQHFNEPYPDFVYADYEQENLIGNVSYRITDADGNKATTHDQLVTLYGYDVHNFVKFSAQITPGLGISVVEYAYNLLNGVVTEIKYNPGRPDQFFQRFSYNAKNQLVALETSTDYVIWEKDASYQYYAHGPLKRTMLGTDNVQGIDYTYTLDGSLKALNHPALLTAKDPGGDGGNAFAKDAFGMVLEYNAEDFVRAGSAFDESSARIGALENPAGIVRNLYNGNIAAMITNAQAISGLQNGYHASQFVYDELNRLKASTVSTRENNDWLNDGSYATEYAYDANGNITSLQRNGNASQGLPMDDLSYFYRPGTNQLKQLTDAVQADAYTSDLSTQHPNNYQYDEAGQLTADVAEGIQIQWTWFSKPETITKNNGTSIHFIYGNDHEKIAKKVVTPDGKVTTTFYVHDTSGKVLSIYERVDEPAQGHNVKTTFLWRESPISGLGRVGTVNHNIELKEVVHGPLANVSLDLHPYNEYGTPDDIQFSYKLSTLTTGNYSFNSFSDAQILNEDQTAGTLVVKDVVLNPTETLAFSVASAENTSENSRQMSASFDERGDKVFSAVATKLNANHEVLVYDGMNEIVPFKAGTGPSLYHNNSYPILLVQKPGSSCQHYLYTQTSQGLNDIIYRHTLDACATGNGTPENPRGVIVEANVVVHNQAHALRFGTAMQAIQNMGTDNTTKFYFLRSSGASVQLSARTIDSEGNFTNPFDGALLDGTPISKIKISADGKQLMFMYLRSPAPNVPATAVIRRLSVGINGTLDLIGETEVAKELLDAEFTADGKFIYYAKVVTESAPIAAKGISVNRPGKKFHIRRIEIRTHADEFVSESFPDEVFNGRDLTLQRSSDGRLYIAAAGHRRMMTMNNTSGDVDLVTLTGFSVPETSKTADAYLSGAFATHAFDRHLHEIETNGTYNSVRTQRQYELNDHLGNVNFVVSGLRADDGSAIVVSANNYYPYGMIMPGRNYNGADYRYAFNGKEKDDEIKGTGNSYDFGARLYDPRVGRWLTRDPLAHKFAGWSDYNAFADNPILYVDPDGREAKWYRIVVVEINTSLTRFEGKTVRVAVIFDEKWEQRVLNTLPADLKGHAIITDRTLDTKRTASGLAEYMYKSAVANWKGSHGSKLPSKELMKDLLTNKYPGMMLFETEVAADFFAENNPKPPQPPKNDGPIKRGFRWVGSLFKGSGAKTMGAVSIAVDLADGVEVDAGEAAMVAAQSRAPVGPALLVDMAFNLQPDNHEILRDNARRTRWFEHQFPECAVSNWDVLIEWDSRRSASCEEKWVSGGYGSPPEPGQTWGEFFKQVEETVQQGKQD